MKKYLFINNY